MNAREVYAPLVDQHAYEESYISASDDEERSSLSKLSIFQTFATFGSGLYLLV
jgi:hypothetical protein